MEKGELSLAYNEQGDADYYAEERLNALRLYEQVYGTVAVMYFCEINVLKYRLRLGKKPGQSTELELTKAKWYERASAFFYKKAHSDARIFGIDGPISLPPKKHPLPWEEQADNQATKK